MLQMIVCSSLSFARPINKNPDQLQDMFDGENIFYQLNSIAMKFFPKTLIGFFVLFIIATAANAQEQQTSTAPWVSDKGYWNTESNIHDPLNHIIRFYTNDGKLFHIEKLSGVKLDIDKRKTKMKLKKALEQTMELYSKQEPPKLISEYLVAYLK